METRNTKINMNHRLNLQIHNLAQVGEEGLGHTVRGVIKVSAHSATDRAEIANIKVTSTCIMEIAGDRGCYVEVTRPEMAIANDTSYVVTGGMMPNSADEWDELNTDHVLWQWVAAGSVRFEAEDFFVEFIPDEDCLVENANIEFSTTLNFTRKLSTGGKINIYSGLFFYDSGKTKKDIEDRRLREFNNPKTAVSGGDAW